MHVSCSSKTIDENLSKNYRTVDENYNDTFSCVDEGLHLLLENRIFCIRGEVTFHKHKNVIIYRFSQG